MEYYDYSYIADSLPDSSRSVCEKKDFHTAIIFYLNLDDNYNFVF